MSVFPNCSSTFSLHRLSLALAEGLRMELDLTPKPGLVDRNNSGSHDDLTYHVMASSIELLARYFAACEDALEGGADILELRDLGKLTEREMLHRFGTNTHRGAIFLGGLMMAGVHGAACLDDDRVSAAIAAQADRLFATRLPTETTGAQVRKEFRTGGIISEALDGLPSVFRAGVPALRSGYAFGLSDRDARLYAMAVLMQRVDDTTALRRCGTAGLRQLKADGHRLEQILSAGQKPDPFLIATDRRYRAQRLTMGGIADLLGVSAAWNLLSQASTSDRDAEAGDSDSWTAPRSAATEISVEET